MREHRYLDSNSNPYEFKACEGCGEKSWIQVRRRFCSRTCSRRRENNPAWKGNDAGYMALHGRVYRKLGPARTCPWGHKGPYEWAHRLGDQGDNDEYVSMCLFCHRSFDAAIDKCLPRICRQGLHDLSSNKDYYVRFREGRETRQCKQCAKDRAKRRYL